MKNFNGQKYVVIGAARQGLALSQYLASHGAKVVLTDSRPESQLTAEMQALQGQNVEWAAGGHPLSLLDGADFVCPSGGVPLTIPLIEEALNRQIPLTNDSQLFLENCPATVIGITGSAGKTTTTALVGLMAQAYMEMKGSVNKAWVGGNIGNPLIAHLDEMHEDDLAIIELSSFQLEIMTRSPQIAAVLNITPNHLDRHATMEAYTAAKSRILAYQKAGDVAVLNRDDSGSWALAQDVRSDLIGFGFHGPEGMKNGTYVDKGHIYLQIGRERLKMLPLDWIQLKGKHNQANVLAACAIAAAASIALPAIQTGVDNFTGVPHRLEFVRNFKGADWYNDSIATAPERALAAIDAFEQPIVLLLGGRDKNLPWDKLAEVIRKRVSRVILFGEAADLIAEAIGPKHRGQNLQSVVKCTTLEEAVKTAANQVVEGDIVLLSPGGTSFDAFKDFEERGEMFRKWVNEL
ncbi:MAG TPA: UDP-N-acetylmuramoyl-L-alanine--D-glutamate ligase [Anaerolineaceae bacterium]|nr:UDP-N-acetylmuramoyl-L-alanine--D-glutamate ligase [Anaerolineaceae bacterium]